MPGSAYQKTHVSLSGCCSWWLLNLWVVFPPLSPLRALKGSTLARERRIRTSEAGCSPLLLPSQLGALRNATLLHSCSVHTSFCLYRPVFWSFSWVTECKKERMKGKHESWSEVTHKKRTPCCCLLMRRCGLSSEFQNCQQINTQQDWKQHETQHLLLLFLVTYLHQI